MKILVQKYGGTSVGSAERIKAVADRIIRNKQNNTHLVIVVSAMGKTTDELIKLSNEVSSQSFPREYDALISTGENVSAALLSMALQDKGHKAISLTGSQAGIKTEKHYSRAKILEVQTDRILAELNKDKVVIVTGFQGINNKDDVTTIGRGGSDTSAVILANALKAPVCEIYTDVDGIYTTDPRLVKKAKKINKISYDEMLELASLGAKVLHPRAVECAKEGNIKLYVKSSFNYNGETLVEEQKNMENIKPVTGVTAKIESLITIIGLSDEPGVAAALFTKLGAANINVDMIIQSAEENKVNNISFTVEKESLNEAVKITQEVATAMNADEVRQEENIAKVSIVGVGMISKPGIAAKMFSELGKHNINIKLISTSEIKVSCAIPPDQANAAVSILHTAFDLENN